MGVRIFRIILPALLGLFLTGKVLPQPAQSVQVARPAIQTSSPAPLQDRMRTWKMAHRHPNPAYLETFTPLPSTDTKERVWKSKEERWGSVWYPSKATWRPDPSAQVDEIRAQLNDAARLEGWK